MSKEMKDLKNIKYKSMLLSNSNYNNLSPRDTNDVNNINDFLEKEKQTHTNELWSKLDKTIKMQKIRVFIEHYSTINNLTAKESKTLLAFLTTSLDQKRLSKVKDVIYDRENGASYLRYAHASSESLLSERRFFNRRISCRYKEKGYPFRYP
jgi:hypothetical protein